MNDSIIVKGAREHNLKNIDLTIPKGKLVVFTGVSGSGKSSMAFDTIYAEGQRRYVESLSAYARQFLGIMSKPDVDSIEGLSPAISIDQKTRSANPRSTVGTITEVYDYFRLLFSKIGHPFCPNCGTEITKLSTQEIADRVMESILEKGKNSVKPITLRILSPVIRDRKGEFSGLLANLKAKGFQRVTIDGREHDVDEDLELIKTNKHSISAIVDTILFSKSQIANTDFTKQLRTRVFASIETASQLSDGLLYVEDELKNQTLYSQNYSCPKCGFALAEIEPRMFSFNSPIGACTKCKGLGYIQQIDPKLVLNLNLTINEGAILPYTKIFFRDTWFSRLLTVFMEQNDISGSEPLIEMDATVIDNILYGDPKKKYIVVGKNRFGKTTSIKETFDGIVGEMEKRYYGSESDYTRSEIERYMNEEKCPECDGMRLKPEVLGIRIDGANIYEYCELSVNELIRAVDKAEKQISPYEQQIGVLIFKEIRARLTFLNNVGLNYLTLNRSANTLSGGESQRIRLASQIGSGLSGVIYVLDEPSIGLHSRDVNALIDSLKRLRDLGNSILVVEHDTDTIATADYVVDFGPLAGRHGGEVVFEGTIQAFHKADTLSAQYLFQKKIHISDKLLYDRHPLATRGAIKLVGARQFNLKNVTVSFPLGKFTCVTGVSGSGKSTLIVDTLYKALRAYVDGWHKGTMGMYDRIEGHEYIDKVYLVDQSPIGKTPRSNPATYVGIFDEIREIFATTPDARIRGYKKGRFSFNIPGGRCEKCQGGGTIKIEMQFLPDVYVTCDVCEGKRYNSETLEVKYKEKTIYDVLEMTIEEALTFFSSYTKVAQKLQALVDVGLAYVQMGQPAPTLSGGESQRIKLAHELARKSTGKTVYILDEPTTGLHLYDIEKLMRALYRLVSQGNTVVVIEHNMEVIERSEHIIDVGPEGGDGGGQILYQGPLEGIYDVKESYTAKYLNKLKDQSSKLKA